MVFMTGTLLDRNKTPEQTEEGRGTSLNLVSLIKVHHAHQPITFMRHMTFYVHDHGTMKRTEREREREREMRQGERKRREGR